MCMSHVFMQTRNVVAIPASLIGTWNFGMHWWLNVYFMHNLFEFCLVRLDNLHPPVFYSQIIDLVFHNRNSSLAWLACWTLPKQYILLAGKVSDTWCQGVGAICNKSLPVFRQHICQYYLGRNVTFGKQCWSYWHFKVTWCCLELYRIFRITIAILSCC
jgi:hypothetical protein